MRQWWWKGWWWWQRISGGQRGCNGWKSLRAWRYSGGEIGIGLGTNIGVGIGIVTYQGIGGVFFGDKECECACFYYQYFKEKNTDYRLQMERNREVITYKYYMVKDLHLTL